LLKEELRQLNSLLIDCADKSKVPAGGALAVDRQYFSDLIAEKFLSHQNVNFTRKHVALIPDSPTIIASGPLTSNILSKEISELFGINYLYFFDAIAPIVTFDSIDMNIAFRASRYDRNAGSTGDYINCPFTQEQYDAFVDNLINSEKIQLKPYESDIIKGVNNNSHNFFESCLPVEEIAKRGHKALAFGPMRPIGLSNPHSNKKPKAIVQLRQDNKIGTLYNLVGFQTNLTYPEQRRIFCMIPGLENANFVRFGQMHRNTFINSPSLLKKTLQSKLRPDIFFAGQLTGSEGYVGSIATGLVAGINAARYIKSTRFPTYPKETMIGSLIDYIINSDPGHFQPMKPNFGILPNLENPPKSKRDRAKAYSSRSLSIMNEISSRIVFE